MRHRQSNPEVESILSDIEDILNQRWADKTWTAADKLQMDEGLELLKMDALEVREPEDEDEENEDE